MASEYVFVDEWDVDAPREIVFDALADARTYPQWWKPVYASVEGEGEPGVGQRTRHHFKGKLPYTLKMEGRTTAYDRPASLEFDVDGDLRGRGKWTLTERNGKTHVRWDWIVFADKPIVRVLTPVLRPLFRWNHNWAVKRAIEGLEPYARGRAGL
ncbi:MAG: SRPBCC family protein [Gaiellaceae bacterium]